MTHSQLFGSYHLRFMPAQTPAAEDEYEVLFAGYPTRWAIRCSVSHTYRITEYVFDDNGLIHDIAFHDACDSFNETKDSLVRLLTANT